MGARLGVPARLGFLAMIGALVLFEEAVSERMADKSRRLRATAAAGYGGVTFAA